MARLGASVTTIEGGRVMSDLELEAKIAAMRAELEARQGGKVDPPAPLARKNAFLEVANKNLTEQFNAAVSEQDGKGGTAEAVGSGENAETAEVLEPPPTQLADGATQPATEAALSVPESAPLTPTVQEMENDLLEAAPELAEVLEPKPKQGFTIAELREMGWDPSEILQVIVKGGGIPDELHPADLSLTRYTVDAKEKVVPEKPSEPVPEKPKECERAAVPQTAGGGVAAAPASSAAEVVVVNSATHRAEYARLGRVMQSAEMDEFPHMAKMWSDKATKTKLLKLWIEKGGDKHAIEGEIVIQKRQKQKFTGTRECLTIADMIKLGWPTTKINGIIAAGGGIPDEHAPQDTSLMAYWVVTGRKQEDINESSVQATARMNASVSGEDAAGLLEPGMLEGYNSAPSFSGQAMTEDALTKLKKSLQGGDLYLYI